MSPTDKRSNVRSFYAGIAESDIYLDRQEGMSGRFDLIYRHWEDPITRRSLRRSLYTIPELLLQRERLPDPRPLRVADLGCGDGKGLEFLISIWNEPYELPAVNPLLNQSFIYTGIDLSAELIEQAKRSYAVLENESFHIGDLNNGLADLPGDDYHIFFSSYGTLSHLDDDTMRRLLTDVVHRSGTDGSLFIADLLGLYSPEWQEYRRRESGGYLPYAMSHLGLVSGGGLNPTTRQTICRPGVAGSSNIDEDDDDDDGDPRRCFPTFPMRFWGGREFLAFAEEVVREAGGQILHSHLQDRSILLGRHMDTGHFRSVPLPIRRAANMMLHREERGEPAALLIHENLATGVNAEVDRFFEIYKRRWNGLVEFADELWNDSSGPGSSSGQPTLADYSKSQLPTDPWLARACARLVQLNNVAHELLSDDARATYAESQLVFLLRELEERTNQGLGCGHGLLAHLYIVRDR